MNDREFRAIRRTVIRAHDHWIPILRMESWDTLLVFHRDDYPIPQEPGSSVGAMYVDPDWRYMLATIHVNMPALVGLSDQRIENNVVHELVHCLVNEMHRGDADSRDHEERVVTTLDLALLSAYAAGWNEGRADLRRRQKAEARAGS